ncbi:unnamed protein product, partial [Rotaria sp. Silwood2]
MSLIDRFACSFGPTSLMWHLHKLKMIPWLILITTIITCLMSLHVPITFEVLPVIGCSSIIPVVGSVLYICMHGILTPTIMLILVLLTYRKVRQSRQRVGITTQMNINRSRNQFITMIFAQAFSTCFLALQWICVYIYFTLTFDNVK